MSENLFGGNPTDGNAPAPEVKPAESQAPAASTQAEVKSPETPDPNSVFANQLAGIKSDDGRQKYADVNTALDSIPHAQSHIKDLMAKNAEMEAAIAKLTGANEVLQSTVSQPIPEPVVPAVAGMDEASTAALVDSVLAQREQAATAEANKATVIAALSKKYGEKAEAVFVEKAAELGMEVGMLTGIALKSPKAALAYFGAETVNVANPTYGGANTTNLMPEQTPNDDHMKIFTGGENDLVNQWRKARPTT